MLTLEIPDKKRIEQRQSRDGWSNYCTWATALVIDNNDSALRTAAIWGGDEKTLPTVAQIEKRLIAQRPLWVGHRAPWLRDETNTREIAEHLAEVAREQYAYLNGYDALPPPEPAHETPG